MNTIQSFTKNTLALLAAQILGMILGFFYTIYTARYLGAEGFGVLSLAMAFTGMLSIFSDMGLPQIIVRDIARDNLLTEKYIGNSISLKVILSIFTLFTIILLVHILNYSPNYMFIIFLIGLSTIIGTFNSLFYCIYQAYEKMEFQSIGQVINSVFLFIGIFITIHYDYGIAALALVYIIVSIINLIYNLRIFIFKFAKLRFKFEYFFWEKLLKEAFPFAITGITINIYLWIDTLILSLLKDEVVVGWYNAAYKLILVILFIPVILNNSIFPLMSKYYIASETSLKMTFKKLLKLMIIIGLPVGFGTVFIADRVILLIYGSQFTNSAIILKILIWSLVLIFIRSPFERLLESTNQQTIVSKIFIIGAIFNIVMNLILIPKYSYIGAGIVTIATDSLVLIFLIVSTKYFGYFFLKSEILDLIKILVACSVMVIFIKLMSDFNLFIIIIFSIIIYIASLMILQILDNDDKRLIKSIFKKEDKNEM